MNNSDLTPFSRLSPIAQNLIVDALLGRFDMWGPPEMDESVRDEIIEWIKKNESGSNPH